MNIKYLLFLISGLIFSHNTAFSQMNNYQISYQVAMPKPHSHYFEVEMTVNFDAKVLKPAASFEVKMPVWTPGSYLVREFSKNVDFFEASANGKKLVVTKNRKNSWLIKSNSANSVSIKYSVYAYEMSVRTSYLDDSHGYINVGSVFMYVPQLMHAKSLIKVVPHVSFSKVSVALPEISKNNFEADSYDTIVDSPIEIGNQEILNFESMGVQHTIANYARTKLNYNTEKLIADYKKVVEAAASVVGEKHPCKNYLFIIHHLPNIGGGLEHLNSTTCQTSPDIYQNEAKYKDFLALLAHEYFHLWNVKRIRPEALGPFDYENENYTNMLWVSEGFTSFYQENILRKANLLSETEFLGKCASAIGTIENSPGNRMQSAAESSYDAWIKFYRPNENSNNANVSYYTKGGVIANVLNAKIIDATNGEKSLDDVLKLLWNEYYITKKRGFKDNEFLEACEKVAGISMKETFSNYIYGKETIDYKTIFKNINIYYNAELANPNAAWAGITMRGKMVTRVEKGSGSYENGIYVNDEILSIDGKPFVDVTDFINGKKPGDVILVKVLRSGVEIEYQIPLTADPHFRISLKPAQNAEPMMIKKYNKFMSI